MYQETEEKFGAIMADGKIYNLDQMQVEEIKNLADSLEERKKSIMHQINQILKKGYSSELMDDSNNDN